MMNHRQHALEGIRRLGLVALAAMTCFGTAMSSRAELPPLIPREVLFGNPEKVNPKLSPTGREWPGLPRTRRTSCRSG